MATSVPPYPNVPPQYGQQPPTTGSQNARRIRNVSTTKNGGGFINPALHVTINEKGQAAAGQAGGAGVNASKGVPGADFMSNEDIRAFCEHLRKDARNRATERAMDADHLEAVLRTIPDATGSRSGSRGRARRVSRWLKKVAAAEKAIQKYSASIYATFEREYEADLRKISNGRPRQTVRKFNFH